MTIAPFMRRWGVLVLGGAFLLVGVVVLSIHPAFAFSWSSYAPMSDMVFYPGLPSNYSVLHTGAREDHYTSLGGQISVALGVTLLFGWVGFALGRYSMSRRDAL